jgi:hypothetical protein
MADIIEEQMERLMAIELLILDFYRSHRNLVDFNVDRIFETYQRHYEKILQGKNPPDLRLDADEERLYKALGETLATLFDNLEDAENQKILVAIMKRLRKSIQTWTGKTYGRQGYLNYIDRMLP